jgi:hypothetical protein
MSRWALASPGFHERVAFKPTLRVQAKNRGYRPLSPTGSSQPETGASSAHRLISLFRAVICQLLPVLGKLRLESLIP